MIKCFIWILKFTAFGVVVAIGTLFLLPQKLTATIDEKNSEKIHRTDVNVQPVNLVCTSKNDDEEPPKIDEIMEYYHFTGKNATLSSALIQFARCRLRTEKDGWIRERNVDLCFCLNDYSVFITIACSGACAIQYSFAMVILCASHVKSGAITKGQGCGLSSVPLFNCAVWVGNGVLQLLYMKVLWPCTYESVNSSTNTTEVPQYYYSVPVAWQVATYMCFGSAFCSLVEFVIWICLTCRKSGRSSASKVK